MNTNRLQFFLVVLLPLLALAATSLSSSRAMSEPGWGTSKAGRLPPAYAQITPLAPEELLSDEGQPVWVVRAYYPDRQAADVLASWLEPWEARHDQGYLVVAVDRGQFALLESLGFRLEVDEQLTKLLNQPPLAIPQQANGIPGYPCYRTVAETAASVQALVTSYPGLATRIDIGDSWEKTMPGGQDGYDLSILRLTNQALPGPKPKLFVMSSIHGREYSPAELVMRFAEYLLANYNVDPDITWILDHHEIHLLIHANPDGRRQAETGLYWRKNTNANYCSPTSSYRGADLNRNFTFAWGCCGGSSGNPCSETFRGAFPSSEPEIQAIQAYVRFIFPDQRGDLWNDAAPAAASGIFLDIHSYGQQVLWPWGFSYQPAPNAGALQTLGRKLAFFNGYTPEQSIHLYPTDGTTEDFAYGELGLAAYTIELGNAFFESCTTFEQTILPDNLAALLYASKVPRTPYLTPGGPDTRGMSANPAGLAQGRPMQLDATVNDKRYNDNTGVEPTQNIASAEYFVDVPPWNGGVTRHARRMAPADGVFDEKIEEVYAFADTTGLNPGRHMVYVRGLDAAGFSGPFTASFFYILDETSAPTIRGTIHDASNNAPLAATIRAGPFRTTSDPSTGFFSMMVMDGEYDLSVEAGGYQTETIQGLVVEEHQSAWQDVYLQPICPALVEDAEGAPGGWTAQSPWAIAGEAFQSPTHSWTDSPGGHYANNLDASLTSPVIHLSNHSGVTLSFWHTYVLENNYDYGYLETSTDGGNTWTVTKTYNGASAGWTQESISLPDLDGQTNVRIRFRLASDENVTLDGWHLDDVVVSGGSLDCSTLLSASAEFTSNSPALVGEAMQFFDLTNGTTPITYQWDFGDGLGTSTETNPTYVYAAIGEYSVSLTASNAWGSTTVTHQVKVSPYGFSLTPAITAHSGIPGSQVAFELSLSNQGGVSDTYDLTIDSTWPVTVMTPGGEWLSGSGLTLDGGETQNLTALITVPPQAETGIPHTTNLDIVSRSEPLQSEHAELITTPDWRAIFLPLVTR